MNTGYERRDISIRGVVLFAIGLAIATLASCLLMWVLYRGLQNREARAAEGLTPATRVRGVVPEGPPAPVLQGAPGSEFELADPALEMERLRRSEDALLEQVGWIDRGRGVVRIPIEQAKRRLLQQGLLQARPQPSGGAAHSSGADSESP